MQMVTTPFLCSTNALANIGLGVDIDCLKSHAIQVMQCRQLLAQILSNVVVFASWMCRGH